MSQRKRALGRIWALIWQATIGYVLAIVIGIIGAIWATIDLLWSLISGRDDLSSSSTPAQWVSRTVSWSAGQTVYGLTGAGSGKWEPLP
ncbi:hypothetical protein [Halomontanus rarus]|uniref:hypothetical protein n=1 Tax=Halomontanus rarus TaxID=3034020 RepID=UPI00307B4B1E